MVVDYNIIILFKVSRVRMSKAFYFVCRIVILYNSCTIEELELSERGVLWHRPPFTLWHVRLVMELNVHLWPKLQTYLQHRTRMRTEAPDSKKHLEFPNRFHKRTIMDCRSLQKPRNLTYNEVQCRDSRPNSLGLINYLSTRCLRGRSSFISTSPFHWAAQEQSQKRAARAITTRPRQFSSRVTIRHWIVFSVSWVEGVRLRRHRRPTIVACGRPRARWGSQGASVGELTWAGWRCPRPARACAARGTHTRRRPATSARAVRTAPACAQVCTTPTLARTRRTGAPPSSQAPPGIITRYVLKQCITDVGYHNNLQYHSIILYYF